MSSATGNASMSARSRITGPTAPFENTDDTRTADPDRDVPAADSPKFLGNNCGGASFVAGQLGVCV